MPNYADPDASDILTEGMVITIEPIIAAGGGRAVMASDGWTVKTADHKPLRALRAHHSITKGAPIVLTAA